MLSFLPALLTAFFGLAVGFLTPLIWIERPILGLMSDVSSQRVKDEDIRSVQAAVHVVAKADAPTIQGIFGLAGALLAVIQTWQRGFDWASLLCAVIAVGFIIYGLFSVGAVAKSAKEASPNDEIGKVRTAIRKEMAFHYTGFIMFLVMLLIQLFFVIGL